MLYGRACYPVAKTRRRSPAGASAGKLRDATCSGRPQRCGGQRRTPGPDPARAIGAASHRAALSGSASLACCFGVSGCPASALPGAPPRRTSGSAGGWLADAQVARLKPRGVRGSPCGRPSCSTQTYFFLPRVHFSFGVYLERVSKDSVWEVKCRAHLGGLSGVAGCDLRTRK